MDKFTAMTVFAKVVEQGSFARAAERLNLSTSAVSRHIADLETHLDARLLNRTTRKLSLTESGQAFFERCIQLLSDLEEAESLATSSTAEPRGTLKLTCPINFGIRYLAPAIGAFQQRYPAAHFVVSLSDRFVDLVDEGLDLAVRIGEAGNSNLIAKKIGEMRLICCASPAYLKRHGTPTHPQDLTTHNCLAYSYSKSKNHWAFEDKSGVLFDVPIKGSVEANNGEMLLAVALQGIGIVLDPDFSVSAAIKAGSLVAILTDYQPRRINIYAAYPSRRHLSAKVRTFVDFLSERFKDRQLWD
jgi:DNA-binding transcriptional LysR family regulator